VAWQPVPQPSAALAAQTANRSIIGVNRMRERCLVMGLLLHAEARRDVAQIWPRACRPITAQHSTKVLGTKVLGTKALGTKALGTKPLGRER
jgi:hypothetical protein